MANVYCNVMVFPFSFYPLRYSSLFSLAVGYSSRIFHQKRQCLIFLVQEKCLPSDKCITIHLFRVTGNPGQARKWPFWQITENHGNPRKWTEPFRASHGKGWKRSLGQARTGTETALQALVTTEAKQEPLVRAGGYGIPSRGPMRLLANNVGPP